MANLFANVPLTPGIASSREWLRMVQEREGSVDPDMYLGSDLQTLATFIADFAFVHESIKEQSNERFTVSFAHLVASAVDAAELWLMKKFKGVLPPRCGAMPKSTFFMLNVLEPAVKTRVQITREVLSVSKYNAALLKDLEARFPQHLPCSLDALIVKGFRGVKESVLTHADKIRLIRSIPGQFTRRSLTEVVHRLHRTGGNTAGDSDTDDAEEDVDAGTGLASAEPEPVVARPSDIVDIFDGEGRKVTELRRTDGYLNASLLLRKYKVKWSAYTHLKANRDFCASFKHRDGVPLIELPANDQTGSIWVHRKNAVHLQKWCGGDGLEELLEAYELDEDDTVPVELAVQTAPDEESFQTLTFGDVTVLRRSSDGYVQATQLCFTMGRLWGNSHHNEDFRAKKAQLARRLGVEESELIQTVTGKKGCVWVHPELALVLVRKTKPTLEADIEEALAREFVANSGRILNIKGADGKLRSRVRDSDGFHDVDTIAAGSPKHMKFSAFSRTQAGAAFIEQVRREHGSDVVQKLDGELSGTWVHPKIAKEFATKCGVLDLEAIFGAESTDSEVQDEGQEGGSTGAVESHVIAVTDADADADGDAEGAKCDEHWDTCSESSHDGDAAFDNGVEPEGSDDGSDSDEDREDDGGGDDSEGSDSEGDGSGDDEEDAGDEDEDDIQLTTNAQGYVNITEILKRMRTRWSDFKQLTSTSQLLRRLSNRVGIPEQDLVVSNRTGTFVHPSMAAAAVLDAGETIKRRVHAFVRQHTTGWIEEDFRKRTNSSGLLELALSPDEQEVLRAIRKTDETPPRVSVYDMLDFITNTTDQARIVFARLQERNHDLSDQISYHLFPGPGQRPTPVATEEVCQRIREIHISGCRMPIADKRKLLGDAVVPCMVYTEVEIHDKVRRAFLHVDVEFQYVVGSYRIDMYFPQHKLAVECDENGHRRYCPERERERHDFITDQLQCRWVRYDPYSQDFDVFLLINTIMKELQVL